MRHPSIRRVSPVLLLAVLPVSALADGEPLKDSAPPAPVQTVGNGAGRPKLELRRWGSPKLLRNPVAIWVDDQGAVYTAETERAGNGRAVLDTRFTGQIPQNILADVGLLSVDDRIAQEKEWEAKGYYPKGRFTATADCVRKIEDTDGNGAADASHVLATFHDYGDGINSGVMALDGGVYATCIPHLWKLTEGADGKVAKESLSYGWGVRLAFYGHDMHGLTQGPDGRIYFSIGDRGFNVTTKEGVHYDMIGLGHPWDAKMDPKHVQGYCRGGVFRCWPDGTGMELFFEGLRNPEGLAFNDMGQLFTGDNNSDIGGDPARFDHLPEYGDGGWRQDVQTFDKPLPQGAGVPDGTAYWRGPWLREKMPWVRDGKGAPADPHDPTAPAWQIPPMMNLGNGPSGMTHMPGTGHGAAYKDNLLMVNYTGGQSQVYAVAATPAGAWYKGSAKDYFNHDRVTDIKWGPDGQLYCSLFGGGWSPGDAGEIYALRDPAVFADAKEKAAIDEVKTLLKEGMHGRKDGELLALLGHRDQRVRQRAQNELARRNGVEAQLLAQAADAGRPLMARVHALWTLWQKAGLATAHGRPADFELKAVEPLLADADPIIRVQAARVLGDLRHPAAAAYIKLLKDPNAQVRFYAAVALGKTQEPDAVMPLFEVLKENAGVDPVLRHGASWALAQIGEVVGDAALVKAGAKGGVDERVGLVIALRRLRSPLSASLLNDESPQVGAEAARAIYDKDVRQAFPALADCLGRLKPGQKNEAFLRRAIEAAATLGRPEDARALANLIVDAHLGLPYRKLALECLYDWANPVVRERVWGHLVNRPGHPVALAQKEVVFHLADLLAAAKEQPALADGVGKLLGRHLPKMSADELAAKVADGRLDAAYRLAMLERLSLEVPTRVPASAKAFLADVKAPDARIRARELLAAADPKAGLAEWFAVLGGHGTMEECQAALHGVSRLDLPAARDETAWLWYQFEAGALAPEWGLDMVEAAAHGVNPELKAEAESYIRRNLTAPGMEGTLKWRPHALLLAGGDAARGQHDFLDTPAGKSCSECHNAGDADHWPSFDPAHEPNGKGGGYPNLGNIGSVHAKDPMYLVRAILDPDADIAPSFLRPSAMYEKYAQELSAPQVRDLVAFLQSCRGLQTSEPAVATVGRAEPNATAQVFAGMFGSLFGLLAISGVASLLLERNKPKLS